jgi:GT2 family glycosyltransferase
MNHTPVTSFAETSVKQDGADEAGDPRLSVAVIIPVHNGRTMLEQCLAALEQSARQPDEVTLVDDGSSEAARPHGDPVLRTGEAPIGPAAARNRAARLANSSVLVFLDSDVAVHRDTLDRLLQPIEHDPTVAAAFGSYTARRPAARRPRFTPTCVITSFTRAPTARPIRSRPGAAIRRAVFLKLDGFDESYRSASIEDIELGTRLTELQHAVCCVPEAQATHLKEWSLTSLWRTNIQQLAIPCARLMLARTGMPDQLNASWSQRIAAIAAHGVWASVLAAVLFSAWWLSRH